MLKEKKITHLIMIFGFLLLLFQGIPGTFIDWSTRSDAAGRVIANNGTGGINIDINSSPYTDFASKPYGQYAYGNQGCAWFASARVKQLTGKGDTIWSGYSWYSGGQGAALGFQTGQEIKAPALVCFTGHVAVLEKIDGNTAYISEGGCTNYRNWGTYYNNDAAHGYCAIHAIEVGEIKTIAGRALGDFLGFVYLGDLPIPTTSRRIYVDGITPSNAVIHWDLDDTPYMGTVGIWVAKANEEYTGKWVEFAPYSKTNKVSVDVNTECGRTLEANTTYKYKFYYYAQNNCIWSDEGTFTTALGSSTPTTSRIIYVDNITETNALIHWDLSDTPYMGTVGIWVAKANEEYTGKWVEFAPYSKTNKVSVDVNAECGRTLEKGTKYKYIFYYYVGNNCTWSNEGTFVTKGDSTKPVITDAEVINLDSNGYTVRCRATDNIDIDRVQCPTWTAKDDQDDIAKDWSTNTSVKATHLGNNVYEFKVKRSDHNNEYGIYHTHIYAYDFVGNYICVALNDNDVQAEHTHSYTSEVTKEPTCAEKGVRTFSCTCGDTYTEEIAANGHIYSEKVVSPTFIEDGYTLHTCDVCGDSYRDNFVDKLSQSENITLFAQVSDDTIKFSWDVPDNNASYGIVYALYEEELAVSESNNGYVVSGLRDDRKYMTYECSTAIYKNQPDGVWFRVVMKNGDTVKHSNAIRITNWNGENSNENPSENPIDNSNNNLNNDDNNSTSTSNESMSNKVKIALSAMTVTQTTSYTNEILFGWDSDNNSTGYIIEYSVNPDLAGASSGGWKKNALGRYRLTKLVENTTYYYRVRSFKGDGDDREYSEWTEIASVKTKEKVVEAETQAKTVYKAPRIKLKSVKNNKKKTITVKWKWNVSVDGYQLSVSKKKNFANAKKKNLKAYYESTKIKGLSKGKTYYVRIRSYVLDDDGDKVYSKWSSVKKVKIKK